MCLVMRWGFVSRTSPNLQAQYMSAHLTTSQYSWLLISTCCLLVYLFINLRTATESSTRFIILQTGTESHTRYCIGLYPIVLIELPTHSYIVSNHSLLLTILKSDSIITHFVEWFFHFSIFILIHGKRLFIDSHNLIPVLTK